MTKFQEMKNYFNEHNMKTTMESIDDIIDYVSYYTDPVLMEGMDDGCFIREYIKDRIFYAVNDDDLRLVHDYSEILLTMFGY